MAVRVRNIGDATSGPFSGLRISTGSTTPNGTFTLLSTTCSGPLPPAGQCTADVRFAPPQPGTFAASLYVTAIPGTRPDGNAPTMTGTGT